MTDLEFKDKGMIETLEGKLKNFNLNGVAAAVRNF